MVLNLNFRHELDERGLITMQSMNGFNQVSDKLHESFTFNDKVSGTKVPLEIRIALRLMGTKQVRLSGFGSDIEVELASKIKPFVDQGLPIPLLTASGSRKYGIVNNHHIDTAELSSLLTLLALGEAVSEIYKPAIMNYIIQEDTGGKYLNTNFPANQQAIDTYAELFSLLTKQGDLSKYTKSIRESELLSLLSGEETFDSIVGTIYPEFLAYLKASDNEPDETKWTSLKEFQPLKEAGWLGDINKGMRDYYYQRVGSVYELESGSLDEKQQNVARLFSGVYARRKLGVTSDLGLFNEDYNGVASEAIRFSFAAPTPGMPTKGGRLFYRGLPKNICSSAIPYRSGQGVMVRKDETLNLPGIRNRQNPIKDEEKGLLPGKLIFDSGLEIGGDLIV